MLRHGHPVHPSRSVDKRGCQAQVQTERDVAAQIEEEAAGAVDELETELEACRLSAEREIEQARREAADAAGRASVSAVR